MINKFGKNLNIMIVTEVGRDWQTFATWYSLYYNLPKAKVYIACYRNKTLPFPLFQWTKRLNVPLFYTNNPSDDPLFNSLTCANKLNKENLLIIDDMTLALDAFDSKITDIVNTKNVCFDSNYNIQFVKNKNSNDLLNNIMLQGETPYSQPICFEANKTNYATCLINYKKGCGKWISTSKGCPFSSAAGLASTEMTVNENRIIELWKRMCSIYSAIT